jgi:hypothetical protein
LSVRAIEEETLDGGAKVPADRSCFHKDGIGFSSRFGASDLFQTISLGGIVEQL